MHYSLIFFWILSVINITFTFDENNQFKNGNHYNKHELQTPCSGHIKSVVPKVHNASKHLNYTRVNITYYNIYFVLFIILCLCKLNFKRTS